VSGAYREEPGGSRGLLIIALNGEIAALSRKTGEVEWRRRIASGGWGAVAVAFDGEAVLASAHSDQLYCMAYRTGEVLWQRPTKVSFGRASIVIEDGMVYVARGGEVECFTREGEQRWHQPLKGMGVGATALGFPDNLVQADERR